MERVKRGEEGGCPSEEQASTEGYSGFGREGETAGKAEEGNENMLTRKRATRRGGQRCKKESQNAG